MMAWIPGGSSGSGGWIWVGDGAPDAPFPGSDTSYLDPTRSTSDTDKPVEHGRVLLAVGEGPHGGLVNGLKSVYLGGVPIQNADGTLNFRDVSVAVCNGTVGQNHIPGFEGAESELGVGQKVLKATPIVRSISNVNATHARVKISVPSLQTIDTTTGKTSAAHLEYKIEVQPNGGSYQTVTLSDGGVIEKQFTSKLIKGYRFALPGTGPWNIRLTRVEVDSWSQYLQNDLYFESLATIIDGNFSYPMTALIAVACNANQFNSIPQVTADWYGRVISVPANYDPIARTYATTGTGTTAGAWDGTFKQAWSDNPAWVFYDMVTNNLFGCGLTTGAPDKWMLYQIAQYCDVSVSDGLGGTEPRFTCSVNIESQDEAIKVIGYLASIFRGSAYWAGGAVVPVQDKDETPTAQFTNSNVVEGKFVYTSSAKPARHTACIVKYNDPTNNYELTPLLVQDNTAVARYGYNPLEVVAYGCASRGQASRLGLMSLTTELSQTEGINFSTAMEGIPLRPGRVIKVHDAFRSGKRFGGRVMASTTTAVTLDAPVTLESGKTYQLSCTLPSGSVEVKAVSTGAGTVSSISVSSAFSVAPQVEGQWILVANDFAPLLYRVLGIKEGTDGAYEVTGLLHNPAKYAAVESGLILDAMPATSLAYHAPVTDLTLTESMAVQTDRLVSTLLASWTPVADITGYLAVASRDGGPWQPMTIAGSGATLVDIQPGSWKARVVARYATGDAVYTESSAYTTTGFSTTTSPAQAAQSGVNAINSVDALTNSDKIQLMESWKAELQTQASLDASATALLITTEKTAYDNAITELSVGLIAAGAPSNWAAVWPDGATLNATGIASSIATWWAAIASKRATLQIAISQTQASAAQAAAISAAATDALTKANAAQIKTPSIATFASTALPALPNASYAAGSCWLTTDGKEYQVTPNGESWQQVAFYASALVGKLFAQQLTVANFDNLVPNPTGEISSPPAGSLEAAGLTWVGPNLGTVITSTGFVRQLLAPSGGSAFLMVAKVPCSPGDIFYARAIANTEAVAGGACCLNIQFKNSSGASLDDNPSSAVANDTASHSLSIMSKAAPSNAAWAVLWLNNTTPVGARAAWFGQLYMRRCADANVIVDGTLQAMFARIARAIQSTNYAAGSAGNAPTGFCLSSTPFTTTFKDGTTDSGCLMELGGSANFGGYKVATIGTQVMTAINRIVNGSFWMSFSPWNAQPRYTYTVTAMPNQTVNYYGTTVTASQNFNAPGYVSGTVRLKFTPTASFVMNSGAAANPGPAMIRARVTVYLKNHYTGVQTTIYQQVVSASVGSPGAPGQQSIDVTSLLSTIPAGYGVACVFDQIYIQDYNGSNASSNSYTGTIDVTGFELIF